MCLRNKETKKENQKQIIKRQCGKLLQNSSAKNTREKLVKISIKKEKEIKEKHKLNPILIKAKRIQFQTKHSKKNQKNLNTRL